MRLKYALFLLVCATTWVGCRADLLAEAEARKAAAIRISVDPESPLDSAPPVVRFRLSLPESADLEKVVLVTGEVLSGRLREISRGEISKALADDLVSAVVFRDADGAVVVAPTRALE